MRKNDTKNKFSPIVQDLLDLRDRAEKCVKGDARWRALWRQIEGIEQTLTAKGHQELIDALAERKKNRFP